MSDRGPDDPEFDHLAGGMPVGDDDLEIDYDALQDTEERHTGLPPKVEAWRRRSAVGAVLTGMALGLQQALEKEREEPAIVMQTSGDPPTDLPVEAEVEQARPRQSVVNIRPWLLKGPDADAGTSADEPKAGT